MKMQSIAVILCLMAASTAFAVPCLLPDNGFGTVDMPPACPDGYIGAMTTVLTGGTIEYAAQLHNFSGVVESPGGSLGGNQQTYNAELELTVSGTGFLSGFNRTLFVPVAVITETALRTPYALVQSFVQKIISLSGELFGDPDFCQFRISMGEDFGLPNSGNTTLTNIGGGQYNVDSFFDVFYEIEMQGCPGSILDGYSDSSTNATTFVAGDSEVPAENSSWSAVKGMYR